MEAALLHPHRRRLLSASGSVGRRQQDVATLPRRRHRRRLVDRLLSLEQSPASHRANVRWLSLRPDCEHPRQEAVGVECRHARPVTVRAAPTPRSPRARTFSVRRRQMRSPQPIPASSAIPKGMPRGGLIDGKAYDWPVGYRVGLRLQDYWKLESTRSAKPASRTLPTARHTRTACRATISFRASCIAAASRARRVMTRTARSTMLSSESQRQGSVSTVTRRALPMDRMRPRSEITRTMRKEVRVVNAWPATCRRSNRPSPTSTSRSHTFKFITPTMSERLKIPNACTGCHTDRSNAVGHSEALRGWTGISPWRATE